MGQQNILIIMENNKNKINLEDKYSSNEEYSSDEESSEYFFNKEKDIYFINKKEKEELIKEKLINNELKNKGLIFVPGFCYYNQFDSDDEFLNLFEKDGYITQDNFNEEEERKKEFYNLLGINIINKNDYKISHETIGQLFKYSPNKNYRELRDKIKNSGLNFKIEKLGSEHKEIIFFNFVNLIKFINNDDDYILLLKIYSNPDFRLIKEIELIHEKEIKKDRRRCTICYINKKEKKTTTYCKICKKYICNYCFINHN